MKTFLYAAILTLILPSAFAILELNPVVDEKLDVFCYNLTHLVNTEANVTIYNTTVIVEEQNLTFVEEGHFLLNLTNLSNSIYTVKFDCGTGALPRFKFGTFEIKRDEGVDLSGGALLVGIAGVLSLLLIGMVKSRGSEDLEELKVAVTGKQATPTRSIWAGAMRWVILGLIFVTLTATTGYGLALANEAGHAAMATVMRAGFAIMSFSTVILVLFMIIQLFTGSINQLMEDVKTGRRAKR